ncbi:RNA-directed DNA polymerase, eukaryota, reverse transcriptase zinc-binding domain protein [Tanacetum coccineum]
MKEFQYCVNDIEVNDLRRTGFHFTWTKSLRNPNSHILKKLDRIMGNDQIIDSYKETYAKFLPYIISDHSPAILCFPSLLQNKKRPFRFANFIADKDEFLSVVRDNWKSHRDGYEMFKLVDKMKKVKKPIKCLSWKNGDLSVRVEKIHGQLKEVQEQIDKDPNNQSLKRKGDDTLMEYMEAVNEKEKLLCQQAKVEWLTAGDKNSAYFHKVIRGRRHQNHIYSICDEDGNMFSGKDVEDQFLKHFQKFIGEAKQTKSINDCNVLFDKTVDGSDKLKMIRVVTDKEIRNAIFNIADNKAPDPDGFTSLFFKRSWSVVGNDVCNAVREFFVKGKLLKEINATIISLVPKSSSPSKVSDFRPIACCNVIYKCITKIITNRIKGVLDKLVDMNQSAFIPGRSITDNILLTQELLRGYGRKSGTQRCAFKIDIQKAYDTVCWKFLEDVLYRFEFPNLMVQWIMECVTTPSFSICVNGERIGYFKGGRELRQGDPMSPYLFTLIMEVLNIILKKEIKEHGNFNYHPGCKELKITHLCFADDLLILSHGDIQSVKIIKSSLELFSSCSGLQPNLKKSTLFCRNLKSDIKKSILKILPFAEGNLPVRYLGVPLVTRKLSINDCKCLVDKVKQRIDDWKNKFLSYAGRLQLIASVLSAMHLYWAQVFLLPKDTIYEIEKDMKGFLWNQGVLEKGKAKVSWKTICSPKNTGGLGLKPLREWNEVLLTKNLWIAVSKKQSLWAIWIERMKLKGRSIWEVSPDSNSSWGWKYLLSIREKVRPHIVYYVD